jgi:hypothetical protein
MTRRLRIFCVFSLLGLVGCDSKASGEECQQACRNVRSIAFSDVEKAVKEDNAVAKAGERGRQVTMDMARAILVSVEDKCVESCTTHGTRKKTRCLAEASTMEDVRGCR